MISVEVQCTAKNSRLEGEDIVTDITFQPVRMNPTPTHADGAVIGTPDPTDLQKPKEVSYNLTSGVLSINVRDSKEADKYQIGQKYQLAVGAAPKQAEKPADDEKKAK